MVTIGEWDARRDALGYANEAAGIAADRGHQTYIRELRDHLDHWSVGVAGSFQLIVFDNPADKEYFLAASSRAQEEEALATAVDVHEYCFRQVDG